MRYLASLKTFLATGRLGPVSTDMNLREVADVLGTPQDWIFNDPSPFYWIYSEVDSCRPKLELCFSDAAPHDMFWFQIEDAEAIRDEFCLFGPMLAMTTDGLSGDSRPSDFLRSGAFDEATTRLALSEDLHLTIVSDRVAIFFGVRNGDDKLAVADKRVIFRGFGSVLDFTELDCAYRLDSIYSFRAGEAARKSADALLTRATCSPHHYLAMLS